MSRPASSAAVPDTRYTIICLRCDRPMLVRPAWSGREVQCPYCASVLTAPESPTDGKPARALAPCLSPRRCFNFGCPRCDCLLESHTGMSGNRATCPTCAARLIVPHLSPSGMPDAAALLEGEVSDPTPVHAYAASGFSAPKIVYVGEEALIECPRCDSRSPVDASSCRACGTPFSMDAAPTLAGGRREKHGATALTFGIVSVFFFIAIIPSLIAIWYGARSGLTAAPSRSNAGLAGFILGLISLSAACIFFATR